MIDSYTKNTIQKNWYVITGGPSTGKTAVIEILQKQGIKLQLNTLDTI